jgi:autoinducer 2-degrading protein
MVVFQIRFTIKPGQAQTFIEATAENAVKTMREPGNLRFELFRDTDDDHQFLLMEIYEDEAALEAHRNQPHLAAWRTATDDLIDSREFVGLQSVIPGEWQ